MGIFLTFILSLYSLQAAEYSIDQQSGVAIASFLGELKNAKGAVSKVVQDRLVNVKVGARFYPKDTIQTGENSFARIVMADDTVLNLGPNSKMTFTEFQITRKTERQFDFMLHHGRIRSQVKNKAAEGDLKIRTPLATMGIRGTELLVNHRLENTVGISQFALISGHVEVQSQNGETAELKQGDGLVVVFDSNKNAAAQEAVRLSSEEWALLANANEFLPFYLVKPLPEDSPLQPVLQSLNKTGEKTSPDKVGEEKVEELKPGTNDNLKKLNEQLKEDYLKKRSS